jgi:hypothetical protein
MQMTAMAAIFSLQVLPTARRLMVHLRQRGAPSRRTQVNDADEGRLSRSPPSTTHENDVVMANTYVSDGIDTAVRQARAVADEKEVWITCGPLVKHPLMFDVSARNCWHALLACHVFPGLRMLARCSAGR